MPEGEDALVTETGCRVRAWSITRAADSWYGTIGNGVYLGLSMNDPRDDRRAELKMTPYEARQIAANLIAHAATVEREELLDTATKLMKKPLDGHTITGEDA